MDRLKDRSSGIPDYFVVPNLDHLTSKNEDTNEA